MFLLWYWANLSGDFLLLTWLMRKRVYRTHPAFVTFIAFALLRTLGLWVCRAAGESMTYNYVWLFTIPVGIAISGWTVGELWRHSSKGLIAGMTVGLAVLLMIRVTFIAVGSFSSYWMYATEQDVIRWLGFIAPALAALAYMSRTDNPRAAGIGIVLAVNGIMFDRELLRQSSVIIGQISIIVWTIGLFLFLHWTKTYTTRSRRFQEIRANPRSGNASRGVTAIDTR